MPKINCPRCHRSMKCEPSNIDACPCARVDIDSDMQMFLNKTKYDCLCPRCLIELGDMVNQIRTEELPTDLNDLILDKHYYLEKGKVVFTEYYHIAKGACCKNGCRHCAYNFESLQ